MKKYLLTLFVLINTTIFAQNYCLNFSGSDHVNISSAFGFNSTSLPVSVEFWVFIPSTSEKGTFINIGDQTNGYAIGVGSGDFDHTGNELIFINNLVTWHPTGVNIGTGWHHVAFTIDGSGNSVIYLDSKSVLTFRETPYAPTNSTYIGETEDAVRVLTNGKIDEIRIWNDVRTQDEIKQYMYNELAGNESNLVAYYKMSDGSGTTLTDNTSGGNNGIISGSAWQNSGAFSGPKWALDFDGIDDIVESTFSFTNASAITIEGWVYPRTFNPPSPDDKISNLAGYPDASALVRIGDAYIDNNQFQFILFSNQRLNSNSRLSANTWYHFAAVYDGSAMYLYINGKLDNTLSVSNTFTTTGNFTLGQGSSNSRVLDGLLDEIRVWSDARTTSEIRENMTKTLVGNEAGLLAYYRADYTDGTKLYDNSGNEFDGTMTNMNNSDWVASNAFNTWIGAESSDWNNTANWSANSIPTDYTGNVGIYSYTGGNELTTNTYGAVTGVNNMVVSTSSAFSLPSDIGVTGNLILESSINIGSYDVSFGNTGYLIEDGGIATGTSGILSASRNFGGSNLSSQNLGGLGLIASTGDAAGWYTVYRGFTQASDGITNGISRYYNFSIQYGQAVDLVFNYLDSEVPGTESNLAFFSATDNLEGGSLTWTKQSGTSLNTSNNTLTLSDFSPTSNQTYRFTAADGDSPLPIELTSFTANINANKVILNWETATEVNNYGFEIQRAVVGTTHELSLQWENIGFVEGHGNSNSPKEYSFTDEPTETGTYSYRLKQIDFDGKFEYSESITVEMLRATSLPTEFALEQNYPNPFNPATSIEYSVPSSEYVSLKVYDILGNEVAQLVNENKNAGRYEVKLDASNLTSGIYIYKIQAGSFNQVRKMMLIK